MYVVQKKDQVQLDRKDEEMKIMGEQLGKLEVTAGADLKVIDDANCISLTKHSQEAISETTVVNGSVTESAKEEVPTNQNGIKK